MVARARGATPTTVRPTREVLRIRQPGRTRAALIELGMQPPRGCHNSALARAIRGMAVTALQRWRTAPASPRAADAAATLADCGPAARVLGSTFFFHGRNVILTRHAESNGLATPSQIRSSLIVAAARACEPVRCARPKRRNAPPASLAKKTNQAQRQERARISR